MPFKTPSLDLLTSTNVHGVPVESIASGKIRHLAIFVGSAISRGYPTLCPTVGEIRTIILDQLSRRFSNNELILRYVRRLKSNSVAVATESTRLVRNLESIPFEQFMQCLHNANESQALSVALAAGGAPSPTPNGFHHAIAKIALNLISQRRCTRISIFTTNYDNAIEQAFEQLGYHLKRSTHTELPNPFGSSPINFVKFHGSISHPTSLVYTFANVTSRFLTKQHFAAAARLIARADYAMFFGYGLNDMDIRPLFKRSESTSAIGTWYTLDAPRPEHDIRGLHSAREGFLRRAGILTQTTNLYRATRSNPFHALSKLVGTKCTLPDWQPLLDKTIVAIRGAIDHLTEEQGALFLGYLDKACNAGKDIQLLKAYALGKKYSGRRHEFVALYLQSFGLQAKYTDAIEVATQIAKRSRGLSRIRALAFSGHIYTLCDQVALARACFSNVQRLTASRQANSAFLLETEYWRLNFEARLCFYEMPGVSSGTMLNLKDFQKRACTIATELLSLASRAERLSEMRLRCDFLVIAAQIGILAGRARTAEKWANNALEGYSQLQLLNGIVLAARAQSWCLIAQGKVDTARASIARAAVLASESNDRSLFPKCLLSLIRVLVYEQSIDPARMLRVGERRKTPVREEVVKECQLLLKSSTRHTATRISLLAAFLKASISRADWRAFSRILYEFTDVCALPIVPLKSGL